MNRCILHCDMNNFYASVECMMNPSLRGRPVAVCGETENRHGIVLAKNYEAKAYGIITGEPVVKARQKCPSLAIVPPHSEIYLEFSRRAKAIYDTFTDLVEPFGLDECWLDVTGSQRLFGRGDEIAETIRNRIKNQMGVTVSIGVSFNKVFAKLGSDIKKPDAVTVIPAESFREVIWQLPAADLLGVGRATAQRLAPLGIHTIGDLACYPCDCLRSKLGKCGEDLWRFANGLDTSRVVPRDPEIPDKTAGHGITVLKDLVCAEEVWPVMLELSQNVGHRLYVWGKRATGVAISVRDNRLVSKQWQCQLSYPTCRRACRIRRICLPIRPGSRGGSGCTPPWRPCGKNTENASFATLFCCTIPKCPEITCYTESCESHFCRPSPLTKLLFCGILLPMNSSL